MTAAPINLQDLRRRLYVKAKAEKNWRVWGLYVHVGKLETLRAAYEIAKRNDGAPGIDGVTFEAIENAGVERFLVELRDALVTRAYRPLRNRRVEFPELRWLWRQPTNCLKQRATWTLATRSFPKCETPRQRALETTATLVLEQRRRSRCSALDRLADLEGAATIAVAQSTVDALGGLIGEGRFMMSGRVLTIYEEGGQYYRQEQSAEDSRRSLEQFVVLRDGLRHFNVVARAVASGLARTACTQIKPKWRSAISIAARRSGGHASMRSWADRLCVGRTARPLSSLCAIQPVRGLKH